MTTRTTPLRTPVFHILLALARGDLHGLGIAAAVEEATEGAVLLGPGTLYRSLKEMARDGLIGEVPAPAGDDDPRRRYYEITERGLEEVRAEATRLARIVEVARDGRVLPESGSA
jgi:DNA-binding PadR family transcriptional regulator